MGLLDNKHTQYYTEQDITLQQVADVLNKKIGEQYKVEFKPKGNVAKQMVGAGLNTDSILVKKNGWHQSRIFLTKYDASEGTSSGKNESIFGFNEAEMSPVTRFIARETGFIGQLIMKGIYGSGQEFYDAILNTIKDEYQVKERTINTGLNALFNKDKRVEEKG